MSIRNGVIASVVAGVILMFVPKPGAISELFESWASATKSWISALLFSDYALPGWGWLLIAPILITGAITILVKLIQTKPNPEYFEYTEDIIRNAKWRWDWSNNRIYNLKCYCPLCDCALVYAESDMLSYIDGAPNTKFYCENCNDNEVASIDGGNRRYAYSLIEREIDRRVRTQSYKKH